MGGLPPLRRDRNAFDWCLRLLMRLPMSLEAAGPAKGILGGVSLLPATSDAFHRRGLPAAVAACICFICRTLHHSREMARLIRRTPLAHARPPWADLY